MYKSRFLGSQYSKYLVLSLSALLQTNNLYVLSVAVVFAVLSLLTLNIHLLFNGSMLVKSGKSGSLLCLRYETQPVMHSVWLLVWLMKFSKLLIHQCTFFPNNVLSKSSCKSFFPVSGCTISSSPAVHSRLNLVEFRLFHWQA